MNKFNKIFEIILILAIVLISCTEEHKINFGFNSIIKPDSKGIYSNNLSENIEKLDMDGFIRLFYGEFELNVKDTKDDIIFTRKFKAPVELQINVTYIANPGLRKLCYESCNGFGQINLNLHN